MKKSLLHLIVILIITNSLCQNLDTKNTQSSDLYFGQKIPGKVPGVFVKGIISIPEGKYCHISFSGKMDEWYLYRWNGTKAEVLFS